MIDKHDLSLEEAIPVLEAELESLRADSDRKQLDGVDADTAFELGYETSIFDLKRVTGPGPEIGIIEFTPAPEETTDDQPA